MPARLFCQTGELAGSSFDIGESATIGRLSQNEITLYPNVISGQHARIYFDNQEGKYFIEDLGSRNGTQVDGTPIHSPMRLQALHVVTLANEIDFFFQDTAVYPVSGVSRTVAKPAAPEPAAAQPVAASASSSDDATQLGDAFGSFPALGGDDNDDEGERTRIGDFGALPDLDADADVPDGERTRLGGFEALPDLHSSSDEDPGERTRLGGFDALPSLGGSPPADSPPADLSQEDFMQDDGERTRIGGFDMTPPLRDAPQQQATFILEVRLEGSSPKHFTLKAGPNTLGRARTADISIPDGSISREHAVLHVRGRHVYVSDAGSKNGTFVDGQRIDSEQAITPTTTLRFGPTIQASVLRS